MAVQETIGASLAFADRDQSVGGPHGIGSLELARELADVNLIHLGLAGETQMDNNLGSAGPGYEDQTAFEALVHELGVLERQGLETLTDQVNQRILSLGNQAGKELFPGINTKREYELYESQSRANVDLASTSEEVKILLFGISLLRQGYPTYSGFDATKTNT